MGISISTNMKIAIAALCLFAALAYGSSNDDEVVALEGVKTGAPMCTVANGQTDNQGTTAANPGDKARCRCIKNGHGISICNTGCGNPDAALTSSAAGCSGSAQKCDKASCTFKPGAADTTDSGVGNDMTADACHAQCKLWGGDVQTKSQVSNAKNTGCNSNGAKNWVKEC